MGDYMIYSRVSSSKQYSLENQRMMCRDYAQRTLSGKYLGSYHDVCSGRSGVLHGLREMILSLHGHKNVNIIVISLSRLGRSLLTFDIVKLLYPYYTIHSVMDDLIFGVQNQARDQYDRAMTLIQEAIAFSEALSKRLKEVNAFKHRKGIEIRRKVQYGFKIIRYGTNPVRKILTKNLKTFEHARRIVKSKVFRKDWGITKHTYLKMNIMWRHNLRMVKLGEAFMNSYHKEMEEINLDLTRMNLEDEEITREDDTTDEEPIFEGGLTDNDENDENYTRSTVSATKGGICTRQRIKQMDTSKCKPQQMDVDDDDDDGTTDGSSSNDDDEEVPFKVINDDYHYVRDVGTQVHMEEPIIVPILRRSKRMTYGAISYK